MTITQLQEAIERSFAAGPDAIGDESAMTAFLALRTALECGEVRSASPDAGSPSGWRVNAWVKQGILLGFRLGALEEFPAAGFSFVDKSTYPVRHFGSADGVRVVPGGSSVRSGAYVAPASSACRPCTSTPEPGWTKAPWWIRTPWSVPALRSASAST